MGHLRRGRPAIVRTGRLDVARGLLDDGYGYEALCAEAAEHGLVVLLCERRGAFALHVAQRVPGRDLTDWLLAPVGAIAATVAPLELSRGAMDAAACSVRSDLHVDGMLAL